ncbi:MAG: leucyl aminopeptidase [Sarcina ventriculi]|uniref:leucyl aminopeptidase n=1 Tax=Sarcina ventriculi TaxID=1267 RepID=UPI00073E2B84|nr:leucyl aminopeptidase [Sarcina ventriculi]MCI5637430.1 leucyl aminopeptidase [Sarcina ventriculi]
MYNFLVKDTTIENADMIIVPLFEDNLNFRDEEINRKLKRLERRELFDGNFGEILNITGVKDEIQNVIFLGLGEDEKLNKERLRRVFGKVQKYIESLKGKKIFIEFVKSKNISIEDSVRAMIEGLSLSNYKFNKYKSDREKIDETDVSITIGGHNLEHKDYSDIVEESKILVETVFNARDLVNEPSNVIYPETLAEEAVKFSKRYGFEIEIINHKKIEELQMNSFLAVGKSSIHKPKVIVMRYFGDKDNLDQKLGLIGKGLTYDSGGYSLKPSNSMVDMKSDMGGAATVIGAISAIAKRKLKINVVAVVAACENVIGNEAYKPGDIISSMAGKNIEILNTDAEGRLTMIDAVTYAIREEHITEIIDVATLTGAALVALGNDVTAVVTNNDSFYKELEKAFISTGEKMWNLPNFDDYKTLIKSDIADLKNTGGRYGGTITAGLFVGEFVENKPWLHLDIAGPAYITVPWDYCPKGGTGAGVRTLYELAKNRSENR